MISRLDKFLADVNIGTRKEIKHYCNRGYVVVDGITVKDPSSKFDFDKCKVEFEGKEVVKKRTVVCVLNKPQGYVTSTDDPISRTVMELVPEEYLNMDVVPVGRLDKDTEGVLLFTNDGALLHKLISPKSNICKIYYAKYEGEFKEEVVDKFKVGIELKDGTICKSAVFENIGHGECRITITEGMYHQVKRMLAACGLHVTYLRRESFAGITCDKMEIGQFKEYKGELYES